MIGQRSNHEPVFLVIEHRVRYGMFDDYERWLDATLHVAAQSPGHLGVQIARPPSGSNRYLVVARFASDADAQRWMRSDERRRLVASVVPLLESEEVSLKSGVDYWFTPPGSVQAPPRWKQWLITSSVIWVLIMMVPAVLQPVFEVVPWLGLFGVRHALTATITVALVVFWIMPIYVRLISRWYFRGK